MPEPLDDAAVYALLHDLRLRLSRQVAMTTHGRDIIEIALRDINDLQAALVVMMDKATETPE